MKFAMQISKCLLSVGVAICVTAVSLGADNEAQIRAREALEKKLNDLGSQSSTAPPPAGVVAPPQTNKPAPAAVSTAAAPPAVPSTVQQEVPQADAAAIARAREALRQLQQAPAPVAPPVAPTPPPAPPVAKTPPPAPPVVTPPPAPVVVKPPPPAPLPAPAVAPNVQRVDAASIDRAREALRQTAQQPLPGESVPPPVAPAVTVATPPLAPPPAPVATVLPEVPTPAPTVAAPPPPAPAEFTTPPQAPSSAASEAALIAKMHQAEQKAHLAPAPQAKSAAPSVKKSKELQFPALEGPTLPISAEKQERLQALLQKYVTDQITPETYHNERAKILAEP